MATNQKKAEPVKTKKITVSNKKETEENVTFALNKENYTLLAIGFAVIIIGFILMVGGKSTNPNVFNPEVFSFRRITLAPIVVMAGFLFEIYAIMKKPKKEENKDISKN
jgi:membrane-bound ClpP family serine protease